MVCIDILLILSDCEHCVTDFKQQFVYTSDIVLHAR